MTILLWESEYYYKIIDNDNIIISNSIDKKRYLEHHGHEHGISCI